MFDEAKQGRRIVGGQDETKKDRKVIKMCTFTKYSNKN